MGKGGRIRQLYQLPININNKEGIMEWIIDTDPKQGVTHRLFINNGKITGRPNQSLKNK